MGRSRDHGRRLAVGLLTALLIFCSIAAWAHAPAHEADAAATQDCPTCFLIHTSQHSLLPTVSALPAPEHTVGEVDVRTVAVVAADTAEPNVRGPPSLPF